VDEGVDEKRRISLDGCLNFRDLGGYATPQGRRVRWGLLYRSDALHHLTERDVRRVRDELEVRMVIDLRSGGEVALEGVGSLPVPPIGHHHVPLMEATAGEPAHLTEDLGELYFGILRKARLRVGQIVKLLAESSHPAVFHCAAGKDRTGMIAAVVLGLLGVREEQIVDDYAFTRRYLERITERLKTMPSYELVIDELPPDTLHAEPETMASLLARIRAEYGSMRGFVLDAGVAPDLLAHLDGRLLTDE
jgi:protein-tyrosine phosphatase